MNDTIFVQLASYRDPQLVPTIRSALEMADNPDRLFFGICWQYDETESLEEFSDHPQVRYQEYHYSESMGLGWARSKVSELYNGEDLTLQLDSHHRFAKGWDTMMMEDYYQAKELSDNPILSTYLTPFEVPKFMEGGYDSLIKTPCLMSQYEFSDDSLLMSRPWYIQDYESRDTVIPARTISGHFYLVDAKFIKEVPYDPEIYFGGYCEETSMSVRAWTSGYDFYSPYRQYIWHEYTRKGRPKHWDDHGTESKTGKTSAERDIYARKKVRQLFEQENSRMYISPEFGLGTVRTLHEYEVFTGIDFKRRRIHDYTLQVGEPPNNVDESWEAGFKSTPYNIVVEWDTEFFVEQMKKLGTPTALTMGILSSSGNELYRKDFTDSVHPENLILANNTHRAKFNAQWKPDKIVMYMFDTDGNHSDRYEKVI